MDKFGKSQPVKRREDIRFLTGQGQYVDDIAPRDALFGYVFRSSFAHGVITTLNVDDARAAEGVHLVLTADDLESEGVSLGMVATVIKNRDGNKASGPERPLLAQGRVRFVGEAVAMIFAETLEQARDAAELIELDVDDLPVHLGMDAGGTPLFDDLPDNTAFDWDIGDAAATDAAFDAAAHTVSLEIGDNRIICNSMEPRGCFADWDGERLHISLSGQGVWVPKDHICKLLHLEPENVHVSIPDVGGGFGMKAMTYPEYFIVSQAARILGKPVRWMSERTEAMLSDNAGRDLTTTTELAFDENLRITGYRLHSRCNMGAYNSQFAQAIQTQLFSRVLTGVYDMGAAYYRAEGFFTNTTQVDAYRGAGRPEAIYVLERAMDRAARELGVDGWELRRRNFIRKDQFPYPTLMDETYDVGDFERVLNRVAAEADLAGFAARQASSEQAGKLRGMGLCYYIESILGAPTEDVKVTFDQDGGATIFVGTQSNGQGHETVYAQFLSDQTGIPVEMITVTQGDSDLIPSGGGTGGSRSVTVQNTVTLVAVNQMVEAFSTFLSEELGLPAGAVRFDEDRFRAEGSNLTPSFLDVADMAREAGRDDLLSHSARATLDARSFPNGAHVCEVEIDPETGVVTIERYTAVDDFGNLINPMLAEGQVHGGIVQGLGQALCEHVVYDGEGQLLTASFMDYAMPRAQDVPMFTFASEPVPSTTNPMGMKGCGEAGTIGSMAAVANAVQDAVWDRGVRQADMPFTPLRVWDMLRNDTNAAE